MSRRERKSKIRFVLPSLIVAAFLLVVYGLKGIYPFGTGVIDWGDMYEINTPIFYYFYDVIKGNASLLYSFSAAGGMNFWGVFAFFLTSPFSFLVLLFPRENIVYATSIILLFKMMLVALTAYIFFNRTFKKLDEFYKTILSVMFAFSGYTLILYTNIMWLDVMILFPILLIGLRELLDNHHPFGFLFTLAAIIYLNFYLSYMVLLFVFFASAVYMVYYVPKGRRFRGVFLLGCSTLGALGLCSFIIIPVGLQVMGSSRVKPGLLSMLTDGVLSNMLDKLSYFFCSALVLTLVLLLLQKLKIHRKFIGFSLSLLVLTAIQVVINPINKIWHAGSYASFPYRYAFIPLFILFMMAAYYLQEVWETEPKVRLTSVGRLVGGVVCAGFLVAVLLAFVLTFSSNQETIAKLTLHKGTTTFFVLLALCLMLMVIYFVGVKLYKGHRTGKAVLCGAMAVEILLNSFLYIGIPSQNTLVQNSNQLVTTLQQTKLGEEGEFYRVKDRNELLNYNASLMYSQNSLAHFTSFTNKDYMRTMKQLGYSSVWTIPSSVDGTLFTDSLLCNEYVISTQNLDSRLYDLVDKQTLYKVYRYKYAMPLGFLLGDSAVEAAKIDETDTVFQTQNKLFLVLGNQEHRLFDTYDYTLVDLTAKEGKDGKTTFTPTGKDSSGYINFTASVTNRQMLYLDLLGDLDNAVNSGIHNQMKVYVNGSLITTSIQQNGTIGEDCFPATYHNGLLELGLYENQVVQVKVEVPKEITLKEAVLGGLNVDTFTAYASSVKQAGDIKAEGSSITAKVTAAGEDSSLVLAIPYDKGWHCTINDKKAEIVKTMGDLMAVPLVDGENVISISYTPPGLGVGSVLSLFFLVAILLLAANTCLFGNDLLKYTRKAELVVYKIYWGAVAVAFVLIYIIPLFTFLIGLVKMLF